MKKKRFYNNKKRKRELTPEQQLAQQIYATLKPQTVGDVTEGLKKIFGPMIEAALQGELENHLGYDHHERTSEKEELTPEEPARATSKEKILSDLVIAQRRQKQGSPDWLKTTSLIADYN